MNRQQPPQTDEEVFKAFVELFDENLPETTDEIDAALRKAGFDPDQVGAEMQALAEQALQESPLNWRNRAKREMKTADEKLKSFSGVTYGSRQENIGAIKSLLGQLNTRVQAGAYFRNLEHASDEDIESLLKELQYLASQQNVQD